MKLIRKKEFVAAVLDSDNMTFVVYIAFLASSNFGLDVHLFCKVQIAFSKADKTSIFIPFKYADFADILSINLAARN